MENHKIINFFYLIKKKAKALSVNVNGPCLDLVSYSCLCLNL